jgi:hypothetical protein
MHVFKFVLHAYKIYENIFINNLQTKLDECLISLKYKSFKIDLILQIFLNELEKFSFSFNLEKINLFS